MRKRPLPNRLKVLRVERQLRSSDVARRLRVSTGLYSQIENGHTKPTDEELDKLATILSVERSALGFSSDQVEAVSR